MFSLRYIPSAMKIGYTIPVHKKGKDPQLTDSYRGITITPIIGKLFEYVLTERWSRLTSQSGLQFGFTKNRSPTMAALLVTETISICMDLKTPTYIALLDVQKAFDVVSHPIVKKNLFCSAQIPTSGL